jgi:hypothetical protein
MHVQGVQAQLRQCVSVYALLHSFVDEIGKRDMVRDANALTEGV